MSAEEQVTLTPLQSAYLRIFEELVPEAIAYFKAKSRDYQGTADGFLKLGSRAQFVQMDRKHVKLQQAVWEGKKLEGEQPEEIVMDQIGHCFLMLCCLRVEAEERERESQGSMAPNMYNADDDIMHWFGEPHEGVECRDRNALCRHCGLTFSEGKHWSS